MSDITSNNPTQKFNFPTFLQAALSGNRPVVARLNDVIQSNIESTSSFRFDQRGKPIRSTQQLNIDWSQFENHCFLMSAEALVNIAFDQIINGYPFNGTQQEIESFFDNLSGFERWVFDQLPKYKGELIFSGSWVKVIDKAGALFPELSTNISSINILNPLDKSFSIETCLFIPKVINDVQVICQKLDSNNNCGFTLFLSNSLSTSSVDLCFSIVSGSTYTNVNASIQKGEYNHIVATLDRTKSNSNSLLFNNFENIAIGKNQPVFQTLTFNDASLYIGSGSMWQESQTTIVPKETLNATLDEFRFFHALRTIQQQKEFHNKSITSTSDLKLYFKFNEPPPPLVSDVTSAINAILLDSSGNNLHSIITNFTGSLRQSIDDDAYTLMLYEHDDLSPVLFPAYAPIATLNSNLLASASLYDDANPNIVTKLVPEHWILQGQSYEGFATQFGNIQNAYGGSGLPGEGELGSTHLFLSFLYMYAKLFDEQKMFVDQFANIHHVDYSTYETTPNTFLYDLAQKSGFDLPPLFNESSIKQFIYAENIDNQYSTEEISLRNIQDELLKRTLINMPKIIKSKGTLYAIKAFLRTLGIDPDNSIRIREFGGPTAKNIDFAREFKIEPSVMLSITTSSCVVSPFLSGTRIEPGQPIPAGAFVNDGFYSHISNNPNDGLLTSGSWTFEALYKWLPSIRNIQTQSLCRFVVTGSNDSKGGILANLIALSGSNNSTLELHLRPSSSPTAPYTKLSLAFDNDISLFDGEKWYVSFGYTRPYENNSIYTGSYFLRASTQNFGEITKTYTTSSNFYERTNISGTSEINAFQELGQLVYSGSTIYSNINVNASGAFIQIGSSSIVANNSVHTTGTLYLNNTFFSPETARETNFSGFVSNVRFWSKTLTNNDFLEHSKNYKSVGCETPNINFNFNQTDSGSFERLRINSIWNQEQRSALATASLYFETGTIILLDQSQNNYHLTGTHFDINTDVLIGDTFTYSYLSPYFDEATSNEKIRIRSARSADIVATQPWINFAPVYKIPESETNTDNTKFAIEFSLIDALNRDIITIFSTLDSLSNIIGSPEMAFSIDYPGLDELRKIYFNQIKGNINFKAFFDFFQWFDNAISVFIEQLLPRKTNFNGTNFTIESHMLERHKIAYLSEESYLSETDRQRFSDVLLLQQVVGTVNKY